MQTQPEVMNIISGLRDILEFQNEFQKRLVVSGSKPKITSAKLLHRLANSDDEILEMAMGHLGRRLKKFALDVDFTHPDLADIFDGVFSDNQDFSRQCI